MIPKAKILSEIPEWAKVARQQKMTWIEMNDRGDIPPMVIAERDGVVWAMAVANQIDKMKGLHAATIFRVMIDPDVMILTFDAHMANLEPGESMEDFKKNKLKGRTMQQACDEDGACDLDLTVDVLLCHRITRDKDYEVIFMPYRYHGKGGEPFVWLDDQMHSIKPGSDGITMGGFLADSLNEIMDKPPLIDDPRVAEQTNYSRDRQLFHMTRVAVIELAKQGFGCLDLVTPRHPEWVEQGSPYPNSVNSRKVAVKKVRP